MNSGGYMGKILVVNLSDKTFQEERLDLSLARKWMGGTGLGIAMLSVRLPRLIQWDDPSNVLVFTTGPLTGTTAPGSGTYCVVTKSPLTGIACAAQSNGFWGARLRAAGYDALIITGASNNLCYLSISDSEVAFHDASDLAGKRTFDTEKILIKRHSSEKFRLSVVCIGPAGENRVRFASIVNDEGHIAASGGVGAVMGLKRLKAIVVGGIKKVPVFDPESFRNLSRTWTKLIIDGAQGRHLSESGTAGDFVHRVSVSTLPVRNLTTNLFPEAERFSGATLRKRYPISRKACHACPVPHIHYYKMPQGERLEEPEYEDLAGWGSNVGITDPNETIKLNHLCDDLGFDMKEATWSVSLTMECFEKGILKAPHVEAAWGKTEHVVRLLKLTANREGYGNLMAEGVMRLAEAIGGDAPKFAVYVKRGFAPHVHDPRATWGRLFAQAMSNYGSIEGIELEGKTDSDLGVTEKLAAFDFEHLPAVQAKSCTKRLIWDSLGVCNFMCRMSLGPIVECLNDLTGFKDSLSDVLLIGRRAVNQLRLFALAQGLTKDDDCVSPRLGEPFRDGPFVGKISFGEVFEGMRSQYYREMGWDEIGRPLPETISALDLKS